MSEYAMETDYLMTISAPSARQKIVEQSNCYVVLDEDNPIAALLHLLLLQLQLTTLMNINWNSNIEYHVSSAFLPAGSAVARLLLIMQLQEPNTFRCFTHERNIYVTRSRFVSGGSAAHL